MFNEMSRFAFVCRLSLISLIFASVVVSGCAAAAKTAVDEPAAKAENVPSVPKSAGKNNPVKAGIQVEPNSAAEAVRIFYGHLRERRFREAMMMTNLRIAVEGLSDAEMDDLKTDFEPLAQQVPPEIVVNGEIVTGNIAIVKAQLPNEDTGQPEIMEIKLRHENDSWVILTADQKAEEAARKEGKNYFFTLRMDVHHIEAQKMMERITRAEGIYALQNNATFADLQTLVKLGFLPQDATTSESTGYNFNIALGTNNKKYYATAVPAVYGKTGKLSFMAVCEGPDKKAQLKAEDNKGAALRK